MSESAQPLDGVTVAILVAPEGTEEVECTEPRQAVADAGATVDVLSTENGEAQLVNNDLESGETVAVDATLSDVSVDDYDALLVPGGTVGADRLRLQEEAVSFVRDHVEADRPLGVICHGPWLLVEADVVEDRTLTSFPSLQTDVRNAGGEWVDEEVVTDEELVTSRKPDDIPAFTDAVVETFAAEAE
ncbi:MULTISPECIES: type 1 glutamine amidotransferase domain-containing protein [Halorussus]|uniref:type 1 glutamine amidotransferase domain-containing protein n=1 Tax=Halorussus TaxID=1070314 RepID=UPI000E20F55E|nr:MULTISPECIES: type 1 glutamine amidotransferase domain-containing protein [Halorussus]NHN57910.1 type 1 glutamine amidotransferase [Halorussus sp. JP-T4]